MKSPGQYLLATHISRGSTKSKMLMSICCRQFVDLRLSEIMEQRNDAAGLRDDDDD